MKGNSIPVSSALILLLLVGAVQHRFTNLFIGCLAFQARTHSNSFQNYQSKHKSAFTSSSRQYHQFDKQRDRIIPSKRTWNSVLSYSSKDHEKNATSISSTPTKKTSIAPSTNTYVPKRDDYYTWLEQATSDVFDLSRIPLGLLTTDDVEHISSLMSHWAKRKSTKGALTVEMLLKRIVDDHNAGNMSVNVTTRMYTIAMDAWVKVGGRSAAERADMIHDGMLVQMYQSTGDINIRPNTISYNTLINAWSKSGCYSAGDMAEKILEKMIEEWKIEKKNARDNPKHQASYHIKPDAVSFTSVIDTWESFSDREDLVVL